jgi:hypothetical protein
VDTENSKNFERDGYLVVEGALDPSHDIEPFAEAYTQLLDSLAYVYFADAGTTSKDYDSLPLPERFATLLAVSGGKALHHLDPVLNSFLPHFKKQPNLPGAQIPALFNLISHAGLLVVVESLIGPEVTASPIYHINFKLAQKHLDLGQHKVGEMGHNAARFNPDAVTNVSNTDPALERFYGFQVGKTGWHMDAISGLYDSHDSEIVNAWISITEASEANGCLLVIPGSHKEGVRGEPFSDEEKDRAIALPVKPGDVVVLHNKVLHSATENTTEDDYRWAFNFRYHPTDQPSGRPFLPGYVARSRSEPETELKNPYLWSAMWERALDHLSENGSPFDYTELRAGNLDLKFAEELTERWKTRAPNPESWLPILCGLFTTPISAQQDWTVTTERIAEIVDNDSNSPPFWEYHQSTITRIGEKVYVSTMETVEPGFDSFGKQWSLFERTESGWAKISEVRAINN